ncbi:MAG TPA: UTP--glucose-1-phosphate uridylyltransferase [Candidatus Saccharimonadales bacterium]|nr:UTP--glucose-1-phosphate uridylyltransferase [Candidatus Saccharimonadales bacterium]
MKLPTKAIVAAAGYGTRFLPQTIAMPKEMLPIVDKPVIQIIVEQLVAAGVTDVIIVTGYTKRAIEDHFDVPAELANELETKGKTELLEEVRAISNLANFAYVRQKGSPKGTARPVLSAKHLLNKDEPFFVTFADDFFRSDIPEPVQLLDVYRRTRSTVIAFTEVLEEETHRYGIADVAEHLDERTIKLKSLVEKPPQGKAPSNFAVTGHHILTPDILPLLEKEVVGTGGEIVLTEHISEFMKKSPVYGCIVDGVWHDTGNKSRYLEAVIDLALTDPTVGPELRNYLDRRLKQKD